MQTTSLYIIGALVVILVILLLQKNKPKPDSFKSQRPKDPNNAVLVFFSADWCHYCVAFQPTWDKFVQNTSVKTLQIKDQETQTKYGVTSFPNIRLYFSEPVPGSNDFQPYTGDRSLSDLNAFVTRSF